MEYTIRELDRMEYTYKLHVVQVTYRSSCSIEAFFKRNWAWDLAKGNAPLFSIFWEEESKLLKDYPIYTETINHDSADDFFKYINYDVALNKKRIK